MLKMNPIKSKWLYKNAVQICHAEFEQALLLMAGQMSEPMGGLQFVFL
jgi:hypothetical protein